MIATKKPSLFRNLLENSLTSSLIYDFTKNFTNEFCELVGSKATEYITMFIWWIMLLVKSKTKNKTSYILGFLIKLQLLSAEMGTKGIISQSQLIRSSILLCI